jgi:hypothetical protein
MKKVVLFLALVVVAAIALAPGVGSKDVDGRKQKGTIHFNDTVILLGVELKGDYLFVHDDAAMTRGEPCTRVYEGQGEIASKLVVSFHCDPIKRPLSNHFIVRTRQLAPGVMSVTEYQFKGDTEGHGTPAFK